MTRPTAPAEPHGSKPLAGRQVFSRVVAAVDGTAAGLEAVRQAARVVAPGGRLDLLTAVYLFDAKIAGWRADQIETALLREAGEAMADAVRIAPQAKPRLVNGAPLRVIQSELADMRASLVVVGTHEPSRLADILAGGVCGELVHHGPCSVLVARATSEGAAFPSSVVAGDDGSPQAAAAVETATYVADRFGVLLHVVTAARHPVRELVAAGHEGGLIVVGARGLAGVQSLASVSERVAHEARCSVLIVRAPRHS